MIKPINKQGAPVLYEKTAPVAPIITRVEGTEKGLSSLSDQSDSAHKPKEIFGTDESGGKIKFVWPTMYLQLVADLLETAESIADTCMGLAATQIWDKHPEPCPNIFIMRWPCERTIKERGWDWQEFINPICKLSGKTVKLQEGCLSYPGLSVKKTRKSTVNLTFQTLTNPRQQKARFTMNQHSWIPHVIQHECDHLKGVCVRSRNFQK